MSKSLQEQLLALGVTDKKKIKRAQHKFRVEVSKGKSRSVRESLEEWRQKTITEKKQKNQLLSKNREEKRLKAEKLAQVRDVVQSNEIDRGKQSDRVAFKFPYGKKIRPFPVSASVREQLSKGLAGLIELDGMIRILPRDQLERCIERLAGEVVFTHLAQLEVDHDGYPPIPDDIDW